MDRTTATEDDQGKKVVSATGEELGMITEVKEGTAYVNPDPGIADTISSKLGWGDAGDDDYELHNDQIKTVTDKEVRLKK